MNNVLVVGVNGMIGSALYADFQSKQIPVYGTTHHPLKTNSEVFYLNLLDPPASWVFLDKKFDIVYLCAGVSKMAICEGNPETTYEINVTKMFALIEHLSSTGSHIIYLSTNQVFSGVVSYATNATPYRPPNEYGRQKVIVETLIQKHCKQWTILRLTKVLSLQLPLFQNWMMRLKQELPIEAFHDMMMAPVALSQVITLLVTLGEKKITGCYQISGTIDISYYDFAKKLARRLGCLEKLVKPVSALNSGIKRSFLSSFTTLDCANTIALCGEIPLQPADVLNICLQNGI